MCVVHRLFMPREEAARSPSPTPEMVGKAYGDGLFVGSSAVWYGLMTRQYLEWHSHKVIEALPSGPPFICPHLHPEQLSYEKGQHFA